MNRFLLDHSFRDTEVYEKRKKFFDRLLDITLCSDEDSYEELKDKMIAVFGQGTTFKEVEQFIDVMNKYSYPTKASYIKKVLDNKKNGSKEVVKKPFVTSKRSAYFEPNESLTKYNREVRCKNLSDTMRQALENAKNGIEIVREKQIFQSIKKDLGFLDVNLVIDYLILLYDLKPVTKDELEKLDYTLNFFKEHVKANIEKLNGLNYKDEEDAKTIRELKMDGEDELDPLIQKDIGRLYTWKTKKLKNLYEYYTRFEEWIRSILDNEEFTKPVTSQSYINKLIKEETQFIVDYCNDIGKISKFYETNIKTLQTVCDTKKAEVKKTFVKKLLLDDNSVENK